jgi:histidine kinase-like protein
MSAPTGRLVGSTSCHWLTAAAEMAALASGNWPLCPDSAPMRWTCYPGIAMCMPGVNASRVRAARDFTITTLQRWGVAERCEDIAIVVSELLTNALRHALPRSGGTRTGRTIRLGLLQPGHCVVCAVADPSKQAPVPRKPEYFGETGRGLHVIAALSDQWGYTTPSDRGKVLWAMFSTRPTPRPLGTHTWPDPQEQHTASGRRGE